jgi:ABC-2 type transport system permease protein
MNQTLTIARREVASLFNSPIAYVVLGLFALGTSLIFFSNYAPGEPATLRNTFEGVLWLMIFLVPAISMRLISEEFRSGTFELLVTTPVSDTEIILGKWLGAMGFFLALQLPLLCMAAILEMTAQPEHGPLVTGMLGLVLVGGLYLAIGTFASAATQDQIIAFILSVFIICFLTIAMYYMSQARFFGSGLQQAFLYMNVNLQFADFNKGLIDTSGFIYFGSGIAFFLFLAVKLLESRRWR